MKNLVVKERSVSENKSLCFQIFTNPIMDRSFIRQSLKLFSDDYYFKIRLSLFGDCFDFYTYWNRRMDHAGFNFDFTIFGLTTHFNIYDNRHWDFTEDNWKNTYVEE